MEGFKLRNGENEFFSALVEIFTEQKVKSILKQFKLTPTELMGRFINHGITTKESLSSLDKGTIHFIIANGRGKPKSHLSTSIFAGSSQINDKARQNRALEGKYPRMRKGYSKGKRIPTNTRIYDPELRSSEIQEVNES